uniref:methylmalonic aciduria and homocystinuria type D homolog, mitochondrial-like n=1 Tax=Ciona intestinalis TaxID=7719 RepID=UPI00006A4188|nr:methylmalonic aciduria and homocystinuria type D homolog, mitochondrial-like [Ciona intestinalis]|eukprot:XP_002121015.1 methylmalonic aciduria and homocystinuria type D homolog, mitochondrial-like [Ciona intestinalis]
MAVSVSRKATSRVLSYCTSLNNIRTVIVQLRQYSGFENKDESTKLNYIVEDTDTSRVWPDKFMGPISPQDKTFPLPGNIGLPQSIRSKEQPSIQLHSPDILEGSTANDKQLSIVAQLIAESDYLDETSEMSTEEENVTDSIIRRYFDGAHVELALQPCPKVLYKEFQSIFLEMPKQEITVITLTQKSKHEMSMWSVEVEEEREKLLENFITTATEVCHLLRANNFWCDFIDPSCGQAYFGPYTNSTMFETDDRYSSLGFTIDDLGCCKVISHKKWGSHSFVGSIVTTAGVQHSVMEKLLQHLT